MFLIPSYKNSKGQSKFLEDMTALIAGVSLVRSGPGELGLWMVPVSFEEQKADTKSDACAEKKNKEEPQRETKRHFCKRK